MIIPILIVGLFIGINALTAMPSLETPQELAEWARCDTGKVAAWIDAKIIYDHDQEAWEPAEVIMRRGAGDCKGTSAVALETLSRCAGMEARIATLFNTDTGKYHAVTLFLDHKGQRGFINSGNHRLFAPDTSWDEIIQAIPDGPWIPLK